MTASLSPLARRSPQTLEQYVAGELRAEIGRQRLSQQQLAGALKLSKSELSRRLSGSRPIKISFVEDVCKLLGISPARLFQWTPPSDDGTVLPRLDSNQKPAVFRSTLATAA